MRFLRRFDHSVIAVTWFGSLLFGGGAAVAETVQESKVFDLGTMLITASPFSKTLVGEQTVTAEEMQQFNRDTVGEAIAILPGVNLSRNSRNETNLYIRGFDQRQVPLFLDGIPQYVPYDGYVDFDRFTTFDLSEIRVGKGAASLLYGPNIMGGAINLVSRKPRRAFEGDVRLGAATGSLRKVAANVGSNQGLWYFQMGLSYLDADSFPLGRGFDDNKAVPTDTGDRRRNAYRTDTRGSLKIGFTPNETDEYAFGYVKQDGEKGNPVYTGRSTNRNTARYWRWPHWDKESFYFISNTALNDNNRVSLRLYEDKYKNEMRDYVNVDYDALRSVPSIYNDKTYGASVELTNTTFSNHELHLALHYKVDRHESKATGSPTERYRDVTKSVAGEDIIRLADDWTLRLGLSYEERKARQVYSWPTGGTHATNGLAELTYKLTPDIDLFTSVSLKTRMPTLKDRFSARLGRALPNPGLKPEEARHFELGLRGAPWQGAQGEATFFYSRIRDAIQTVIVPNSSCDYGDPCEQAQNVGEARHRGIELSLEQAIGDRLHLGAAYTYLDRDNLSDRDTILVDTPTHRLFAHATWDINSQWQFQSTLEAEKGRDVNFSFMQTKYREVSGFAIFGMKAVWKPVADLSLELGVNNLGDKNYELSDGYPMPGRTWFTNATYTF